MQKEQFIYVDKYGNKAYYSDREMTTLHREDGPAIEHSDGCKWWYLNGKRHREDGPAVNGLMVIKSGGSTADLLLKSNSTLV